MANYGVGNVGYSLVGGSTGGIIVIVTPAANQTPAVLDISGAAGNSSATWKSFTFVVNSGTIDIDGETFQEGTYSFGNGDGNLNAVAYDATGSLDAKIMIQS